MVWSVLMEISILYVLSATEYVCICCVEVFRVPTPPGKSWIFCQEKSGNPGMGFMIVYFTLHVNVDDSYCLCCIACIYKICAVCLNVFCGEFSRLRWREQIWKID